MERLFIWFCMCSFAWGIIDLNSYVLARDLDSVSSTSLVVAGLNLLIGIYFVGSFIIEFISRRRK
jgi:hypothetical protein